MRYAIFLICMLFALPSVSFAHATPVESAPASGAQLEQSPEEVSIRFSERLEEGSSRIRAANISGMNVEQGPAQVKGDRYSLSVPVHAPEGTYIVSWSVISADDGHFTKGSFAFSVGTSTSLQIESGTTVIQITSVLEAGAMFVEFLGNSILWAALILYAFVWRVLKKKDELGEHEETVHRGYGLLIFSGVLLGMLGGIAQISWKSLELSRLQEIFYNEALLSYIHTTAGSSTLYRSLALFALLVVFMIGWKRIFNSDKFSIPEYLLVICLLIFAYFRSIVSHATANLFYPELSVIVNIFHLIEKDLWFGVVLVLFVLTLTPLRRSLLPATIPGSFRILSANLALLSISASYIIWLHLKSFEYVMSTLWGDVFVRLLASAVPLIALRAYHVFAIKYRKGLFERLWPYTIAGELVAATFVIFFTSLIIITSPPHGASGKVLTASEEGTAFEMRSSPYEDNTVLLVIKGRHEEPTVRVGDDATLIELQQRFEGGYVFPLALIQNQDTSVDIVVPREGKYDARVTFVVGKSDFLEKEGHGRVVNHFSLVIMCVALAGVIVALTLLFLGRATDSIGSLGAGAATSSFISVVVFALLMFLFVRSASAFFGNDFKVQCLREGNMWHMMQPMKGGKPLSRVSQEGCMLMNGLYHIADGREYEYLRSLQPAESILAKSPERPIAGTPTEMTLSFKEKDGSPALLSVEHEKLVHMVIVSKDLTHFAHIHAEETQQERNSSVYKFSHVFPKAGDYLIAVDILHGLVHESKQFTFEVFGNPAQTSKQQTYPSPGVFQGYTVTMDYAPPLVGSLSTIRFTIRKDGEMITDLVPYLGAAMHVAILKNDMSAFIHSHGEVHPPGYTPPTNATHAHAPPPARFGPIVEAHVTFPSPGLYSIFAEFKHEGRVVPTMFSLRVEE